LPSVSGSVDIGCKTHVAGHGETGVLARRRRCWGLIPETVANDATAATKQANRLNQWKQLLSALNIALP